MDKILKNPESEGPKGNGWGRWVAVVGLLIALGVAYGVGVYNSAHSGLNVATNTPKQTTVAALVSPGAQAGFQSTPTASVGAALPTVLPATEISARVVAHDAQTVNGVKVEGNFWVADGQFVASICYPMWGSNNSWQMGQPYLTISNTGIRNSAIAYVGPAYVGSGREIFAGMGPAHRGRCATAYFALPAEPDLSHFTLAVPKLETSAPEAPDCAQSQAMLDAVQSGIVIRCVIEAGYFGLFIVKHPASMTEEDASRRAADTFAQEVTGPWVFTGSLMGP